MTRIVLALVLVAACGKSDKAAPKAGSGSAAASGGGAVAAGDTAQCAKSIAAGVGRMVGSMAGAAEVADKLKGVLTKHCETDKWPQPVIDCFANDAKDMPSMKACREKLPPNMAEAARSEIMQVMAGAGGGGMMPPHATGSGSGGSGS